jgi:hypothetical protein
LDPFLTEVLRHYAADIEKFRPGFTVPSEPDVVLLMLRDVAPTGMFLGTRSREGVLRIDLDYVAPPYRDLRSGASPYGNNGSRFTDLGGASLVVADVVDRQREYFESMDFTSGDSGDMARFFYET